MTLKKLGSGMIRKVLKLYRGLSSEEFRFATEDIFKGNKKAWAKILAYRAKGNFDYPAEIDRIITLLHKNLRLEYQYFTDSKAIAEGYARKVGGVLVEVTIPVKDVLEHFDIEFQNFGRRKKQFEIIYCIKGSTLVERQKQWRLKVLRKS